MPVLNISTKSHFTGRGVTYLFPIQVKTFGPVYEGKDLIAQARTGTGKTFSFAIPLIERLQRNQETIKKSRSPKVTFTGSERFNYYFYGKGKKEVKFNSGCTPGCI